MAMMMMVMLINKAVGIKSNLLHEEDEEVAG